MGCSSSPPMPPAAQNNRLTGKAPYKFESGLLQQRVWCEPDFCGRVGLSLVGNDNARKKLATALHTRRPMFLLQVFHPGRHDTAAPTELPTMRMNMIDDVAIPRSFQPTLAWVETRNAVLQKPMPVPIRREPAPAQRRPLAGPSIISTNVPAIRNAPPTVAASR